MTIFLSILLCVVCLLCGSAAADSFDRIKADLERAACVKFEFISIIESDIFESVDSTYGTAYLAGDGRYLLEIGGDVYLYDHANSYTYSAENNQVIIEAIGEGFSAGDEISFITNLGELYATQVLEPDSVYRLTRLPDAIGDYPDSLILSIDASGRRLQQIQYYDVNEELNRIVFAKQELYEKCDEFRFEAAFPDTVDRVKL